MTIRSGFVVMVVSPNVFFSVTGNPDCAAPADDSACLSPSLPQAASVVVASSTALTALTRQPTGYVYHDADMLPFAQAALEEVVAVARASGVVLPPDTAERALARLKKFPPGMYASMANDLLRGRRLELESLSGYVVRRGRELGVPTPVHAFAYACLKPYLNGAGRPPKENPS